MLERFWIAEDIYNKLVTNEEINLHRDTIDIGKWQSIKEYMQSIEKMDYTILLISDAYLKSANCMYEVLEVMKNSKYINKIFPAVINNEIYKPIIRAQYVRYWQNEYQKLNEELETIQKHNLGSLTNDLKRYTDIASNIAEFLTNVADLNNPNIPDVTEAIIEKLKENHLIYNSMKTTPEINANADLEYFNDIYSPHFQNNITDADATEYILNAFNDINNLFNAVCQKYEKNANGFKIIREKITSRDYVYTFFKNGKARKKINLFLDDKFGSLTIGVSENYNFGSHTTWNEMYSPKFVDGKIKLSSTMNMFGSNILDIKETTKDIWKRFVEPYL